ncbi:MAG: Ltp family lipoprotein [Peptoniphilaceae bacterium]|nr:Ltp family lipoprotein [Peptoniphilaceae bacterium]
MSKDEVYNQLTSEFEGFTEEQAQYAIDNLE